MYITTIHMIPDRAFKTEQAHIKGTFYYTYDSGPAFKTEPRHLNVDCLSPQT
jgi:hypothetical protein